MTSDAPRLFVLRHAHAAKATPGQRDYDRPLDDRGHAEARAVRAAMEDAGYRVAAILCSGARRTRETLEGLGPVVAAVPVRFADELYDGGPEAYLDALRQLGEAETALVVGHNPMVSDLVGSLATDGEPEAMRSETGKFRPASLAVFGFEGPFEDLAPGGCRLLRLIAPDR
jgi:phosphohistidine phosphatase